MFLAGSGNEASQPAFELLARMPPPDHRAVWFSAINWASVSPSVIASLTRPLAASANFDDLYQIDPDLSIKKCLYRNLGRIRNAPRAPRGLRSICRRPLPG